MITYLNQQAREIFLETMRRVDVRAATSGAMTLQNGRLAVAGSSFLLSRFHTIVIVAVGKAASAMYEGVVAVLRDGDCEPGKIAAIVVAPEAPVDNFGKMRFHGGSHPIPDTHSILCANEILACLRAADDQTLVVFLISGGASSMMEAPSSPEISSADLAAFNRKLVGSGLSIMEMNTLRKRLSAVKGGKLAHAACPAHCVTLIVSDVPADHPEAVGSGPSLPCHEDEAKIGSLVDRLMHTSPLPPHVERALRRKAGLSGTSNRHPTATVLSSDDLAAAAAKVAREKGFYVEVDNTCDEWTLESAVPYLLERSRELNAHHSASCLVSVGELGVKLPPSTGLGGRNQHFVLQCAQRLAESGEPAVVLRAGSDGIDGNSPAAGALCNRTTLERARQVGLDACSALQEYDSYTLFHELGDTLVTGPTGNNVRDLCLVLRPAH